MISKRKMKITVTLDARETALLRSAIGRLPVSGNGHTEDERKALTEFAAHLSAMTR